MVPIDIIGKCSQSALVEQLFAASVRISKINNFNRSSAFVAVTFLFLISFGSLLCLFVREDYMYIMALNRAL